MPKGGNTSGAHSWHIFMPFLPACVPMRCCARNRAGLCCLLWIWFLRSQRRIHPCRLPFSSSRCHSWSVPLKCFPRSRSLRGTALCVALTHLSFNHTKNLCCMLWPSTGCSPVLLYLVCVAMYVLFVARQTERCDALARLCGARDTTIAVNTISIGILPLKRASHDQCWSLQ